MLELEIHTIMRCSIAAIEQFVVNLPGVALGPLPTEVISDHLGGVPVGIALAATLTMSLAAALSFWLAGQGIARSTRVDEEVLADASAAGTGRSRLAAAAHREGRDRAFRDPMRFSVRWRERSSALLPAGAAGQVAGRPTTL